MVQFDLLITMHVHKSLLFDVVSRNWIIYEWSFIYLYCSHTFTFPSVAVTCSLPFSLSKISVDIVLLSFIGISVLKTSPHPNGHTHFNVPPHPHPSRHTHLTMISLFNKSLFCALSAQPFPLVSVFPIHHCIYLLLLCSLLLFISLPQAWHI